MNVKNLVIDLSIGEAGVFEESAEQLQQRAYERLRREIQNQLKSVGNFSYGNIKDTDITYPRAHNAFLIEGSRGSGKTTFLLKSLQKLSYDVELQLCVLRLIDPTLIETKENIVVVIISAIEDALEQVYGDVHALNGAREALAEGLGLLDGIGGSSVYGAEWEDAKWVMSQGLRKAKKGRDFEKKLGAYIERALELLRKKAFVLTFDDVDTNFAHGYVILETVRKYLTHPSLVIVLSGDLELYGRLLRKNIYTAFGEETLRHDPSLMGSSNQKIGDAVLELEEQYLLKIVPPQNRIPMIPLGGLSQYAEGNIDIKIGGGSSKNPAKVELRRWASEIISSLMHETPSVAIHPFFNMVVMEPLRLVLGYLRALDVEGEGKYSAILTAFSTRLHAQGVPADLIVRGDLNNTLRIVFEWISNQKDAPELARFGLSSDLNRAVVVHCLALSLAQKIKGHAGSTLKSLLGLALPLAMMRRPELTDALSRKSLFDFLWSQSAVTASEVSARLVAVDRINERASSLKGASFGSVGLASKVETRIILEAWYRASDNKPTISEAKNTGGVSELSNDWLKLFGQNAESLQVRNGTGWLFIDDLVEVRCGKLGEVLRLPVSKRFNERGEVMRSISALSLFGVIGDILASDSISSLDTFGFFDIVPPFDSAKRSSPSSDQESDYEYEERDEDVGQEQELNQFSYEVFMGKMRAWHKFANSLDHRISPAMLGRIASRIHDDLLSLDEKVTAKWRSGEILHRQIICILHGVLATTSSVPGRKETSKTSDQAFVDLLKRFHNEMMPTLAAALLSCPLVWMFLNPTGLGCRQNLGEAASGALKGLAKDDYAPGIHVIGYENESMEVLVGPTRGSRYVVEVLSFYQILNVVPRYAAR
ncbi:hypothetical protein ACVWWT_004190 [Pseudomonas sp. TE6349]